MAIQYPYEGQRVQDQAGIIGKVTCYDYRTPGETATVLFMVGTEGEKREVSLADLMPLKGDWSNNPQLEQYNHWYDHEYLHRHDSDQHISALWWAVAKVAIPKMKAYQSDLSHDAAKLHRLADEMVNGDEITLHWLINESNTHIADTEAESEMEALNHWIRNGSYTIALYEVTITKNHSVIEWELQRIK